MWKFFIDNVQVNMLITNILSLTIPAMGGYIIYKGKRYLQKKELFDNFSQDILDYNEDFKIFLQALSEKCNIANKFLEECKTIQEKINDGIEIVNRYRDIIFKSNLDLLNKVPEDKTKLIEERLNIFERLNNELLKIAPKLSTLFLEIAQTGKPDINVIDIVNKFHTWRPSANDLILTIVFKIPSLKNFETEKLGFISEKHRKIKVIYQKAVIQDYAFKEIHNSIQDRLSKQASGYGIDGSRRFFEIIAEDYIMLYNILSKIVNLLQQLIQENNKVRKDFDLKEIPEDTYKKNSRFEGVIKFISKPFS